MKPDQRMRLNSLAIVNRIADARELRLRQIELIEKVYEPLSVGSPKFCITVDGLRMDEYILAVARPAIVGELKAQIASLDRDLAALGVDVGSHAT